MRNITEIVPLYLKNPYRAIMRHSYEGREKEAIDNWGDLNCPFCDVTAFSERKTVRLGDTCWKCDAEVIQFI